MYGTQDWCARRVDFGSGKPGGNGSLIGQVSASPTRVSCAGNVVAVGTEDGTVRVFDLRVGERCIFDLTDHTYGASADESSARQTVAKAKADALIVEAEQARNAKVQSNEFAASEASSRRDLELKQQEYQREVNEATAKAEAALKIETAKQEQEVIKQKTMQKVEEATVMLQVTEREVERMKAQAEGESGARLLTQRNEAESMKVDAEAKAFELRQIGLAQADSVKAQGIAEAQVVAEKVKAYPSYADERMVQIIVRFIFSRSRGRLFACSCPNTTLPTATSNRRPLPLVVLLTVTNYSITIRTNHLPNFTVTVTPYPFSNKKTDEPTPLACGENRSAVEKHGQDDLRQRRRQRAVKAHH